jgi:hypothetical protein
MSSDRFPFHPIIHVFLSFVMGIHKFEQSLEINEPSQNILNFNLFCIVIFDFEP